MYYKCLALVAPHKFTLMIMNNRYPPGSGQEWRCLMAPYIAAVTDTPLFVMNSLHVNNPSLHF